MRYVRMDCGFIAGEVVLTKKSRFLWTSIPSVSAAPPIGHHPDELTAGCCRIGDSARRADSKHAPGAMLTPTSAKRAPNVDC